MRFQELPQSAHPDYELRLIREADLETLFSYLSAPAVIETMGEDRPPSQTSPGARARAPRAANRRRSALPFPGEKVASSWEQLGCTPPHLGIAQ